MNNNEKAAWLDEIRVFIQSAVEAEQPEPTPFKLETELRIEFVLAKISEAVSAAGTP
jgi:hypothetical protein